MKKIILTTKYLLVFIAIISFSGCRALYYNLPDLSDHELFPYRKIYHDVNNQFTFSKTTSPLSYGEKIYVKDKPLGAKLVNLNEYCKLTKTAAYLIIRNDSLLYEYYGEGYGEPTIFNSFSVTKAFLTTLTGIAIDESKIISVNDPVSSYIDESSASDIGRIKIRQLLKHTSGIKFNDNHKTPFSDNAKFYYMGKILENMSLI